MKPFSADRLLAFITLASLAAVGLALVSQHVFDMQPCAWCVFQRVIYLLIAAVGILGLLSRKTVGRQKVFSAVIAILSVGGIAAALYQHNVASQSLSCAQTLADQFMTKSGLESALPAVFGIYAGCADAVVEVLGIKYEIWSLILFAVLGLAALAAMRARHSY